QRIAVFRGVGRATVSNVDGELLVDVASASIEASNTRGWLRLDTGSGPTDLRGAGGEAVLAPGPGRSEASDVRGAGAVMDTGGGSTPAPARSTCAAPKARSSWARGRGASRRPTCAARGS